MPLDAAGREPGAAHYGEPSHASAPSGDPKPGGSKLSKKLGPLPLWGWGVVGAAVLGFLWYRARSASSSTTATSATGTDLSGLGAVPTSSGMSPLDTSLQNLVNAQQAVIQSLQSNAPGTSTSVASSSFTQPVTNLYNNLLGRAPDTSGATFFGNELGQNPTSSEVLQAFQQIGASSEAQQYAAANPQAFWTGAYREVLNREPDAAGIQYWQHLAQTTSLQNATQQFAASAKSEANK